MRHTRCGGVWKDDARNTSATQIHSQTGMRDAYEWEGLCGIHIQEKHTKNTCYAATKSLTWSVSIGRFGSETGSPGSFPGHCHPSSFFSPFFDLLDSRVQMLCSQMDLIHGISQWYFTSDRKMAAGVESCRHHPAEPRRNTESTCQLRDTLTTGLKRRLKYVINEMERSTPSGS